MPPRLSGFKVFWPGVETGLKLGLTVIMLVAVFLPVAWGYREHTKAEVWRDVACRYRLKEALRERLITAADLHGPPCARLAELGLDVQQPVRLPGAGTSAMDDGAWPAASVSQ